MWDIKKTRIFLLAKFLPSCMLEIHRNICNYIKLKPVTWACFLGYIKDMYTCQLIPHALNNFPKLVPSSKRLLCMRTLFWRLTKMELCSKNQCSVSVLRRRPACMFICSWKKMDLESYIYQKQMAEKKGKNWRKLRGGQNLDKYTV